MRPLALFVDLQNDFLSAAGLEPPSSEVVRNAARLLAGARERGLRVVHAVTSVDPETDDRMPHWKALGVRKCVRGTPGHRPPPELAPRAGEPVVSKSFFSAFSAPELAAALAGADTLLVAGVHLHGCVRATVLDAYAHGLAVWVAEDAVGSDDPAPRRRHAPLPRWTGRAVCAGGRAARQVAAGAAPGPDGGRYAAEAARASAAARRAAAAWSAAAPKSARGPSKPSRTGSRPKRRRSLARSRPRSASP